MDENFFYFCLAQSDKISYVSFLKVSYPGKKVGRNKGENTKRNYVHEQLLWLNFFDNSIINTPLYFMGK